MTTPQCEFVCVDQIVTGVLAVTIQLLRCFVKNSVCGPTGMRRTAVLVRTRWLAPHILRSKQGKSHKNSSTFVVIVVFPQGCLVAQEEYRLPGPRVVSCKPRRK